MLEILFEDNHLLVVNKEKGMLSQIDPQGRESAESLARVYLKEKHNKPGDAFVHAVHRFDKDVGESGCFGMQFTQTHLLARAHGVNLLWGA